MTPYYSDSHVTLYLGDLRTVAPLIPTTPGQSRVVWSDPRYSENVHSKSRAGTRDRPLVDGNGRMSKAAMSRSVSFGFSSLSDDLRDHIAFHSARLATRWVGVFSDELLLQAWREALQERGLEYIRTLYWHKLGATPQFTGDRPASHMEHVTVGAPAAVVSPEDIEPDPSAVECACCDNAPVFACERCGSPLCGELCRRKHCEAPPEIDLITLHHTPGRKIWNGGGHGNVYRVPICLERGGSQKERRIHTTQKPEELIRRIMRDYANWDDPDELWIDLTAGGCTTLAVAKKCGKKAIGIELDEKNAEKAAWRLQATHVGGSYYALSKQGDLLGEAAL